MRKIYFAVVVTIFMVSPSFVSTTLAQPPRKVVEQAKKLADEGNKLFKIKNYRQALDRYQRAVSLLPNYSFPALYYNKGFAHFTLQEYQMAVESLDKAFDQGYPPMEIQKIRWYANFAVKNYDAALVDAQEVVKTDPNNSLVLVAMGDIYREKGMFDDAVVAYEKASVLIPNNGDLYYYTADSYARAGKFTETGVTALKAIQNNTRFLHQSWILVGSSFFVDKKIAEAADAYERAISAKPEAVEVYPILADIYQRLNRLPDAIEITRKGIQLSPTDGSLYGNLAWLLSLSNKPIEAIGAGKKAIEFAPDQYMGYTNLCRAYMEAKDYASALQICNNALKLKPEDGETFYYIGRIYAFQNKTDLSQAAYKRSVPGLVAFTKERPDYSDGYYLLGSAYLVLNQVPDAIAVYKKCLELNPTFAKVMFNLGYAYVLNKDIKSAKDIYNRLQQLDPKEAAELLPLIPK